MHLRCRFPISPALLSEMPPRALKRRCRRAVVAVSLLGKPDGLWGNDKVRIPLREWIVKTERAFKMIGRGKDIHDLKLGVNRAAEQAVPQAKTVLSNAVNGVSVHVAKGILTGGDH
jgi:hypothetical protein